MSTMKYFKPLGLATGLFIVVTAFLLLIALPVEAATPIRVYAANSCKGLSEQRASEGSAQFIWNGNEGIFGNTQGTNGAARFVCPVTRQKVGSTAGAEGFVWFTGVVWSLGDRVSCTMTSRSHWNGGLVSTATISNVNQASSLVLLRMTLPSSSSYGHYSLQCTVNNIFNVMQSYRIREF